LFGGDDGAFDVGDAVGRERGRVRLEAGPDDVVGGDVGDLPFVAAEAVQELPDLGVGSDGDDADASLADLSPSAERGAGKARKRTAL